MAIFAGSHNGGPPGRDPAAPLDGRDADLIHPKSWLMLSI